jgi:hypothetical protein
MRFRANIGKASWFLLLPLGLNLAIYLLLDLVHPTREHELLLIAWGIGYLFALTGLVSLRSICWELTPSCLIVRRLWTKREIPWAEVREVGWLGPMSGTFRVNVGHRIEDYDRLYFEPSDRAGLAAALHKFAPHANFEID